MEQRMTAQLDAARICRQGDRDSGEPDWDHGRTRRVAARLREEAFVGSI
ncbi:MAG: hypothetical protein U0176_15140 [Bacteroidia bacterium]